MQKNDIDKRLEESAINTAVADLMDIQGEELWKECQRAINEADAVHPDDLHKAEFNKALEKASRNGKIAVFFNSIAKPAKYVVTSLAVVVVAFSVCVISVDAFRVRFIDWLMKLNDTHMTVDTVDQDAVNYNDDLKSIIFSIDKPIEYNYKSTISEDNITTTTFEDSKGHYIVVTLLPTTQTVNIDDENSSQREDVLVNDTDAIFVKKDNNKKIVWKIGDNTAIVFTNDEQISKDSLIQIAESIK